MSFTLLFKYSWYFFSLFNSFFLFSFFWYLSIKIGNKIQPKSILAHRLNSVIEERMVALPWAILKTAMTPVILEDAPITIELPICSIKGILLSSSFCGGSCISISFSFTVSLSLGVWKNIWLSLYKIEAFSVSLTSPHLLPDVDTFLYSDKLIIILSFGIFILIKVSIQIILSPLKNIESPIFKNALLIQYPLI